MPRIPNTLQLTLTWMQAIAVALTIGGSIVYACVEIRVAVREIQEIGNRLAHHESVHERLEADSRLTHSDLDRRLSRIEGANGR